MTDINQRWAILAMEMISELRQDYAPGYLSELDGVVAIKELRNKINNLEKRLEVTERFCRVLKCRSCEGYYAEGYICDCGRDNTYSNKEWKELKK